MARGPRCCKWVGFAGASLTFVKAESGVRGSAHIRPLHWYLACRLVLEGGFHPDEVTPRPPFRVRPARQRLLLEHDPGRGAGGERTILGGLKTKDVDVVVVKEGVGPVLAVSVKGTLGAFRNLTNRMEEAVGDCTNVHITYPALVYGFFHVIRANRSGPGVSANDVALREDGRVSEVILRYHDVMSRLAGRADVRADPTKYEAVALVLVSSDQAAAGDVVSAYPPPESPLLMGSFFEKLYAQYDQRFVFPAPGLDRTTRRMEWDGESPALSHPLVTEYSPRVTGGA